MPALAQHSVAIDPSFAQLLNVLFSKMRIIICVFIFSIFSVRAFVQEAIQVPGDITYFLYNREANRSQIYPTTSSVSNAHFIPKLPCIFITHGWTRSVDTPSVQDIVQAYMETKDANVIAVDWRRQAGTEYSIAAETQVPQVGEETGKAIKNIHDSDLCSYDTTHLIGHSLGAHVMGIAARYATSNSSNKLSRITGLDPAGPLFDMTLVSKSSKLMTSDANCVDVVHSNTALFGYSGNLGDIDFFPNGGSVQPGCSILDLFCSHRRAFQLYAESVKNEDAFPSRQCYSDRDYEMHKCDENVKVYMGYSVTCKYNGSFYLKTGASSPYTLSSDVNST